MLMYALRDIFVLRARLSQWLAHQEHTVTKLEYRHHVKLVQLECIVLLVLSLSHLVYAVKDTIVHRLLLVVLK